MISFRGITKTYGQNKSAVRNINLEIAAGEFVCIVGQSGSGKSTLAKLLVAEIKPTEGDLYVYDWHVNKVKRRHLPKYRRNIGVVFQDFKLLEKKTAYENLSFAMEVSGARPADIKDNVPKMLEIVGLKDKYNRFPVELSGGEQQRIAIARAMIHEPSILIADEPTGNLDAINSWDIIQLLLQINTLGTTVVLATHAKDIVNNIKRRVVTLEEGEIIRDQEEGRYVL